MTKVNYEYKSKVLNDYPDVVKDMRLINRAIYIFSKSYNLDDDIVKLALEVAKKYYYDPLKVISTNKPEVEGLIKYPYYSVIKEAIRLNNAYYSRKRRLQKHISNLFSKGKCYFLTLTFRDDVLASTSFNTRRQYVYRFLKSLSSNYVANVDYGSEYDREHYHAIIVCDYYHPGSWRYGFDFFEVCKSQVKDTVKLSKYISKLTNHAYKESARRFSIIYSK